MQEDLPARPDMATLEVDFVVHHATLLKLGHGDATAGRRLLRTLIDVHVTHDPPRGPIPRPPTVRIATEADEDGIIELLRMDHAENASMVAPFDEAHVRTFVYAATRERIDTIGVIDGTDCLAGLVRLTPESWWFSPTWYVAERLLFVHPQYRRGTKARDLLKFAMSFVDDMTREMGSTVFLVGSVVGTADVDRKSAVYGRLMTRGGGIFIHPPPAE
jgi:hypothetical protein